MPFPEVCFPWNCCFLSPFQPLHHSRWTHSSAHHEERDLSSFRPHQSDPQKPRKVFCSLHLLSGAMTLQR